MYYLAHCLFTILTLYIIFKALLNNLIFLKKNFFNILFERVFILNFPFIIKKLICLI